MHFFLSKESRIYWQKTVTNGPNFDVKMPCTRKNRNVKFEMKLTINNSYQNTKLQRQYYPPTFYNNLEKFIKKQLYFSTLEIFHTPPTMAYAS